MGHPTTRHSISGLYLIGLAGAYTVAGKLGLMLAFIHASASPVWPPTGIALAGLLLLGLRAWPAIFLAAFIVNVTTAGSLATSLGIAAGNTLEGIVGAWLVTRCAKGPHAFDDARDTFRFALLAGVLATMVSATVGVGSLALGGYASWRSFGDIWLTWWLGDLSGALVVAPVLILWAQTPRPWLDPARAGETALLLFSVALVGISIFMGPFPALHNLAFLCGPLLVWAALRFGQRDAATAIALLSGMAIAGTLRGFGPFVRASQNESLLLLQTYMATMALMAIPLAALVAERRRHEVALARVAAIVESSDDAIIGKTLDGVITHWNAGAERLYGYTAREAIGQPITFIMPAELSEELPKILEQIRLGEHVNHYETVRVRRDGGRLDVSVTVSPVRDDMDRIAGASSIARDVTGKHVIELTRRERDMLRSVATLATAAAHEINNPLAIVLGQIQLLAKETGEAARHRIDEISLAARRIHDIVESMRHIRRLTLAAHTPHLEDMLDLKRSSALGSREPRRTDDAA